MAVIAQPKERQHIIRFRASMADWIPRRLVVIGHKPERPARAAPVCLPEENVLAVAPLFAFSAEGRQKHIRQSCVS